MGILGLTSFMIEQRTREISIRNVLGAGLSRILVLFGKEFLILILVSFVIAAPLSYWGLSTWLDAFSTRMNLGFALFIIPLLITLIIAGGTIGSLVFYASRKNPVDTLKYE
jgi:putative ABC transport system permease protein